MAEPLADTDLIRLFSRVANDSYKLKYFLWIIDMYPFMIEVYLLRQYSNFMNPPTQSTCTVSGRTCWFHTKILFEPYGLGLGQSRSNNLTRIAGQERQDRNMALSVEHALRRQGPLIDEITTGCEASNFAFGGTFFDSS